jgi:DtxR family Mn-dependent transcriptional regulator
MFDYSNSRPGKEPRSMANPVSLTATLENYLEAIGRLVAEKGEAHTLELADALSVHKSTVTAALKSLAAKDLIHYSPYEAVTLTPQGEQVAREIVRRHGVIRRFLAEVLAVDGEVAEANACRMEHVLDEEVLERLRLFAQFVRECPRAGEEWLAAFQQYAERGGKPMRDGPEVERCMEDFRERLRRRREQKEQERTDRAMTTLDQLKPGQKGRIGRVGSVGAIRRRIVDMGVVRGTPIEVLKVAPLGDPIEVKVKGYNLSLRKAEAGAITVELE